MTQTIKISKDEWLCYLKDEWSLSEEKRKFIRENYLLFVQLWCNGFETKIIERQKHKCIGVYYSDKDVIKWN